MNLTINTWDGPVVHSDEIADPTTGDIENAIGRLDGAACTEVSLAQDDPFAYFTVAGGAALYLVTGETADEQILQLTDPDAGTETIALVCGGQLADFPRHDLVTRDAATDVLRRFLERGDYDPDRPWDIQ